TTWVFPGFWLGGLVGGTLFGVGMVLAGGCGAGSIWRAGEGHVKLWVAILGFSISGSLAREAMIRWQLRERMGTAVFLPNVTGWAPALWLVLAVLAAWYLFAAWNEKSGKLSLTS
ncbi:MAG TPA: YeeE/YedE thiosulfate transporter family protein, partial [Candidatus Tectomicrobia bacterium]